MADRESLDTALLRASIDPEGIEAFDRATTGVSAQIDSPFVTELRGLINQPLKIREDGRTTWGELRDIFPHKETVFLKIALHNDNYEPTAKIRYLPLNERMSVETFDPVEQRESEAAARASRPKRQPFQSAISAR